MRSNQLTNLNAQHTRTLFMLSSCPVTSTSFLFMSTDVTSASDTKRILLLMKLFITNFKDYLKFQHFRGLRGCK